MSLADIDAAFGPEFDPAFYRQGHPDLAKFSDAELVAHYDRHGRAEGRLASPLAMRAAFVAALRNLQPALEIGPFASPCLAGRGVRYLDVLDTEQLKQRAREHKLKPAGVPHIDYVSQPDQLDTRGDRFTLVFSCHAIEHQPDLVRHLQQVESILVPGGAYAVIVPDCRYCFDHFLAPSNIAMVLQAFAEKRTRHTLASVVEHRALTTHNDPRLHWQGNHGEPGPDPGRLRAALDEWEASPEKYHDVHAWQFTPASFRRIMQGLHDLGLTRLAPLRVYDTPYGQFEFCALLAPSSDQT
ncbi:MAG: hypothetical protein R3D01_06365 [Hyphomicrobiales bacterium]